MLCEITIILWLGLQPHIWGLEKQPPNCPIDAVIRHERTLTVTGPNGVWEFKLPLKSRHGIEEDVALWKFRFREQGDTAELVPYQRHKQV